MQFTHDDITRQFDAGTFARGEAYARRGMDIGIERDGDRIRGEVEGSGRNRYRQTIRIKTGKPGVRFSGDCSCPMAHNCKHVVAVLLTELARGAMGVSAEAGHWLRRLADIRDSLREAEAEAEAPGAAIRLVDVLVPERRVRVPGLFFCTARFERDRSIARASLEEL